MFPCPHTISCACVPMSIFTSWSNFSPGAPLIPRCYEPVSGTARPQGWSQIWNGFVSWNDTMMQKRKITDEDLTLFMHKYEKADFRAYHTLFTVVNALVVQSVFHHDCLHLLITFPFLLRVAYHFQPAIELAFHTINLNHRPALISSHS